MSNINIKRIVNRIQAHMNVAENINDVTAAVNIAIEYGKPISYSFSSQSGLSYIFLGAIFLLSFVFFSMEHYLLSAASVLAFILGAITLYLMRENEKQLLEIERKIYKWSLLNANKYKPEVLSDYESIKNDFYNYDSYGRDQKVIDQISGRFGDGKKATSFRYYKIRSSRRHGDKTVKYERHHFVIPFQFYKNIQVTSGHGHPKLKERWKTPSTLFNKQFNVYTDSTESASRFLKPSVIEAFQNIPQGLWDVDLELSANSQLCFSYAGNEPFSTGCQYGLKNPVAFLNEITGKVSSTELDSIQTFLQTVLRHSDNNFKKY